MDIVKSIEQNAGLFILVMFALLIANFAIAILALVKIYLINARNRRFFSGKEVKSLDKVIFEIKDNIKALDNDIQELFNISNKIHNISLQSISKVEVMRFNPFKDIGGDQSFSVALLDRKNSGLIISSLHTKENTRVYSKPIKRGKSDKYPLTDEEKEVLQRAILKK